MKKYLYDPEKLLDTWSRLIQDNKFYSINGEVVIQGDQIKENLDDEIERVIEKEREEEREESLGDDFTEEEVLSAIDTIEEGIIPIPTFCFEEKYYYTSDYSITQALENDEESEFLELDCRNYDDESCIAYYKDFIDENDLNKNLVKVEKE